MATEVRGQFSGEGQKTRRGTPAPVAAPCPLGCWPTSFQMVLWSPAPLTRWECWDYRCFQSRCWELNPSELTVLIR